MRLRLRSLVQSLATQNRKQEHKCHRINSDVKSELNQTMHRDANDSQDRAESRGPLKVGVILSGAPACSNQ
jgi:hypothetical protein